MKTRTALLLVAATGALAAGCSSKGTVPTDDPFGQTKVFLRRMQSCDELTASLKADAKAKMNRQLDLMIEQTRIGWANYGQGGGGFGGPPMASGAAEDSRASAPTAPPSAGAGASGNASSGGGERASSALETNTQVKGVDEADIVKNDKKYIYLLHGQSFTVVNAWPASSMGQAGSLAIEGQPLEMFVDDKEPEHRVVVYSRVDGSTVFAAAGILPREEYSDSWGYQPGDMARGGMPGGYGYWQHPLTKVTVLSVNGGSATVTREVYFEGNYLSSRRVGQHVRTVLTGAAHGPKVKFWKDYSSGGTYPQTEDAQVAMLEEIRAENVRAIDATTAVDWLPYTFTKSGSQIAATMQRCEDLWVPPAGTTAHGMTQVRALDLDDPGAAPRGQAILGAVDTVYSSAGAMYLAARGWIDPWQMAFAWSGGGDVAVGVGAPSGGAVATPAAPPVETRQRRTAPRVSPWAPNTVLTTNYTHLHKFDLTRDPAEPTYVASGTAPGSIKDQFSLDERNDVLRISTTERKVLLNAVSTSPPPQMPQSTNDVFTFSQSGTDLAKAGEVVGLAPGEQIFSTRFVGRYGYVVTFRQVDPLFVIDLDDVRQPKVLGELKIPGFSTYMHPLDDGHLLTIGRDADATGRQGGLALQIFDVSNPLSPRQAHKYTFSGAEYGFSEAAEEHKAFTYFAEKKLLAFPYVAYGNNGGMKSTLEVFDVDVQAGIRKRGAVDHTALFGGSPRGYCGGYFGPQVRRGVFMDNIVYSVSYGGVIASDIAAVATPVQTLALPRPVLQGYAGCAESPIGGG